MRKYWIPLSDWSVWTPERRLVVEAWCTANGMELAIDVSVASKADAEKQEAAQLTPRTYPNEWS